MNLQCRAGSRAQERRTEDSSGLSRTQQQGQGLQTLGVGLSRREEPARFQNTPRDATHEEEWEFFAGGR